MFSRVAIYDMNDRRCSVASVGAVVSTTAWRDPVRWVTVAHNIFGTPLFSARLDTTVGMMSRNGVRGRGGGGVGAVVWFVGVYSSKR